MSILYSAPARSKTRNNIHDFKRGIGRHALMATVSPSLHSLPSSCASSFVVRGTYFPYMGCLTRRSTDTAMVLSILLLTTLPVSRRCPGTGVGPGVGAALVSSTVVSAASLLACIGVDIKPYLRAGRAAQAQSSRAQCSCAPSQTDPASPVDPSRAPCAS